MLLTRLSEVHVWNTLSHNSHFDSFYVPTTFFFLLTLPSLNAVFKTGLPCLPTLFLVPLTLLQQTSFIRSLKV